MHSVQTSSFNSKLVRLKGRVAGGDLGQGDWFQFQTGSIKSQLELFEDYTDELSFNSKLVRLKGSHRCVPRSYEESFNSKLVRLKVKAGCAVPCPERKFQFQTGSIKRRISARILAKSTSVSIPNWFD